MAVYKNVVRASNPLLNNLKSRHIGPISSAIPRIIKVQPKPHPTSNMSLLFPRIAIAPVRCAPVRHEVAPLWSLFDETFSQLERASKRSRKQFQPSFDVKEAKDSYLVEGELPGFNPKDLSIEFLDDGHTLQIKGRSESHTESGSRPQAVEAAQEQTAAVQEPTTSETTSVKSHQASVEDEAEEPANASAVSAEAAAATTEANEAQAVQKTQEQPKQPEFKKWISERYTGEFSRSFKFPSRVNQEAVKASLKDGILSITLPFAEKSASRRINIE